LPVLSSSTFDNTGAKYNISRVLSGGRLDLAAYEAYSPMYISMAYSISYVRPDVSFPSSPARSDRLLDPAARDVEVADSSVFLQGLNFAAVTAIVVHTFLYSRKEIWSRLRDSRAGGEDVHKRLMRSYREVPDWWYGVFTVVVLGLGIFTIRCVPLVLFVVVAHPLLVLTLTLRLQLLGHRPARLGLHLHHLRHGRRPHRA